MPRVTVGLKRWRAIVAHWSQVPTIGQYLQPFAGIGAGRLHKSEKFSSGIINPEQTKKKESYRVVFDTFNIFVTGIYAAFAMVPEVLYIYKKQAIQKNKTGECSFITDRWDFILISCNGNLPDSYQGIFTNFYTNKQSCRYITWELTETLRTILTCFHFFCIQSMSYLILSVGFRSKENVNWTECIITFRYLDVCTQTVLLNWHFHL